MGLRFSYLPSRILCFSQGVSSVNKYEGNSNETRCRETCDAWTTHFLLGL